MRLISTSSDVKCHEWAEGTLHSSYRLQGSHSHISSVSCSKDNGWVVVVPNQGYAEVVSFNGNAKSLSTIKSVSNPTSGCFPNTTKRIVALGTSTGQIMLYDIKKREIKKKFPYAPSTFFKIEYTNNDKYIVAGCENGSVFIYNSILANVCDSFKVANSRTLTNFQCHPLRNNYIAACSEEGIVGVWDLNRSKSLMNVEAHKLPVASLAFMTHNFDLLGSAGMDRNLTLIDIRTNKTAHTVHLKRIPTTMCSSSDGGSVAIGFKDGNIESFDVRKLDETVFKFKHNEKVTNIVFEPTNMGNASVLSLQEDTVCDVEERRDNSFRQMVFSPLLQEIPEIVTEEHSEGELKDSFFDALGVSNGSIKESPVKQVSRGGRISDGVRMLINSKPGFFHDAVDIANNQTIHSNYLQDTESKTSFARKETLQASSSNSTADCKPSQYKSLLTNKTMNSTPVDCDKKFPVFQESPIPLKQLGLINAAEIKEIMREVIREEYRKEILPELLEFKREMKFHIMDVMRNVNILSSEIFISHTKRFNQLEEKLDRLRLDLECNNCADSGYGCP